MTPNFSSRNTLVKYGSFVPMSFEFSGAKGRPLFVDDSNDGWRFAALQRAHRVTGGIVSGESLSLSLREHVQQPISLLARWIVNREVVSLNWRGDMWLPVFQFDSVGMVRPGVRQIITELSDAFDDWELAEWFAMPNCWLQGASPASTVSIDVHGVLQAARTDRFVALG